jgi:Flp pilus assembly protein TadB
MPGREYTSSMDEMPKSCLIVCVGLGAGVFIVCAFAVTMKSITAPLSNNFFSIAIDLENKYSFLKQSRN